MLEQERLHLEQQAETNNEQVTSLNTKIKQLENELQNKD